MIVAPAWAGRSYAVFGLARSGAATVCALLASGASVVAWDADEAKRGSIGAMFHGVGRGPGGQVPVWTGGGSSSAERSQLRPDLRRGTLELANLETDDLAQFDALVVSPGVPINRHPIAARARAAGVPIIGDIELFAQARASLPRHRVVGITGTNGKSTTTALVHHILRTAGVPSLMGGNIGLPILAQEPLPAGGVYVLELSSYQIDLTRTLDCDVAVLLNITPDHLDRYASFAAYYESKVRLFDMQSSGRAVVLGNVFADFIEDYDGAVFWTRDRGIVRQGELPTLQGPHNTENAAAAIEVGLTLGVSLAKIYEALRTYPGLPHRMERVRTLRDVLYVNDSKATNPDSTAPALAAYPAIRWILGGQAKTPDLDACAPHFSHVRSAHTVGEAGALFAGLLRPHVARVEECGTLDRAVASAATAAEPGDTVLLSPACASFDQFRDFEERGDTFRRLVEALP